VLRSLQGTFNPADYPDLIVGLGDPDDAAIWRLDERRALVATTDVFTPVVDDAYDYGAIAAANALSDVYAMGGRPFLALNIAALPPDLPAELVGEILLGGAETAREAGVVIAGGHTIQDKEPKYGLVVIGFVDPQHILTKGGARPGDKLVLSKPLGFGTTTTALKRQQARAEDVSEVTRWMKRLNRDASSLAVEFDLRGGTDITGFSLLGHAWEIAQASGVSLRFRFEDLPFVGGAKGYAAEWIFPGGASDNRLFYSPHVKISPEIDDASTMLLFDPQTSGGLLLCVPEEKLDGFLARAQEIGQPLWVVGEVSAGGGIEVSAQ
jgi:selenide,water dikinase